MGSGSPLIGRDGELSELERRLISGRLVTVTGPGGCGKTRIAVELARRSAARTDAVESVVVELTSVQSAEQLVDALLRALGAHERFGRRPVEVLMEFLAGRQLLLVLDNCEHLVPLIGSVVGEVVDGAPEVRVLATSREPLGLPGESVFRLGPLGLPELGGGVGAVVSSDAGRLFVERAAAVSGEFALSPSAARSVARICHELDGLPLPLCLAAARVDTVTPSEIADALTRLGRLDGSGEDTSSRHRSVRASLDWSYQLLDASERATFRGLSAFAGGFTAAAAHAVAAPDLIEDEVFGLLDSLESKGLIMPTVSTGSRRWEFLQTVGEYALEQLALEGEQERIEDRHLAFFAAYAADADELLLTPAGHELVDRETANLRRALERAVQRDVGTAVQVVASLLLHWFLAEHFEEAEAACATVLSASDHDVEPGMLGLVHSGAALLGMFSGAYADSIANAQAGLALLARTDGSRFEGRSLVMTSMVLIATGLDLEEGRRQAHRSVELTRASADPLGLGWALANAGMADAVSERFDAVREAYDEFLTIPDAREHVRLRAWAELAAAWAEVLTGSPERALAHTDIALALEGDRPSMTHFQAAGFRIQALGRLGRTDEALAEATAELTRARESGALQAIPAIELGLVVAELFHGDLDAAEARGQQLLGMPQVHTLALVREVLGRIALIRGNVRDAQAHAGELDAISERTGSARHQALAQFINGSAAVLAGDTARGRNLLQAALATDAELGLGLKTADVLDELALLPAANGDVARTARLAAAAAAERARLGSVPLQSTLDRVDLARKDAIAHDRAAVWEAAWAQGEQLSLVDAIGYARRRRGRRDRPPAGWGSLTPAELDVSALAANGLSNPQIASQLFVSRATVKMHLSSVYQKLHVANRTELAAAIATRSSEVGRRNTI
jgi:predicted ATPase/DNA-binding CsgD family transcriptional regulator